MKSPTYFRIRAVAVTAVFALSLATATAATTNVIFSFEEDEGEYADTDLETDSAGNIYGTTVLGGDFGGGTVFQLSPTANGWVHTCSTASRVAPMEASRTKESHSIAKVTYTARQSRAGQVAVKAAAVWLTS